MSITGTATKLPNGSYGLRLPLGSGAQPGMTVTKQLRDGRTFPFVLGEVVKQYEDAEIWSEGNGDGGSTRAPATSPAGPPAAPAPQQAPASTGPAGRVTLSEYITVCKLAYEDFVGSNIPPEQAGSMATSVAIQYARGAENDLDPFGG